VDRLSNDDCSKITQAQHPPFWPAACHSPAWDRHQSCTRGCAAPWKSATRCRVALTEPPRTT